MPAKKRYLENRSHAWRAPTVQLVARMQSGTENSRITSGLRVFSSLLGVPMLRQQLALKRRRFLQLNIPWQQRLTTIRAHQHAMHRLPTGAVDMPNRRAFRATHMAVAPMHQGQNR